MYLGNIICETWNVKDKKKTLAILLAASKKSVTRKWLKLEPPTIDEWIEVVYEIHALVLCVNLPPLFLFFFFF